jgi:hypothetical protein
MALAVDYNPRGSTRQATHAAGSRKQFTLRTLVADQDLRSK